jgi:pyrimidine operon attenuation protein/uracil phosphoribosyltransferase
MSPSIELPDAEALYVEFFAALRETIGHEQCLIGIHTGGAWLAERLHRDLRLERPLGILDVSMYRDDFSRIGLHPEVRPSRIPFDVDGADIWIIDDVLYTGRTLRAALNELFDYGRPARVRLAILIDRGGRELPIAANVVGRHIALQAQQNIQLERDPGSGRFRLSLHEQSATDA